MRHIGIYFGGLLIWLPCAVLLLSESITLSVIGFIYAVAVWNSPSMGARAKRFWRIWHRENFRVINAIE